MPAQPTPNAPAPSLNCRRSRGRIPPSASAPAISWLRPY